MLIKDGKKLKKVYDKAYRNGYGFIASNVAEPNIAIGLIRGADKKKSDLILQLSQSACKFAGDGDPIVGLEAMGNYIDRISSKYDIGVFINMDHLKDIDFLQKAVKTGMPASVMIDASDKIFKENVKLSKKAREICHKHNILVEAELGKIKGIEDGVSSDEEYYTDPSEALEFVKKTQCDLLAISIGTQHGVSKGKTLNLRKDIAEKTHTKLQQNNRDVPLVVHGSSGLRHKDLKSLIGMGVVKFNKDTRYQYEYSKTALEFLDKNSSYIIPPAGKNNKIDGFFPDTSWAPDKEKFDPRNVSEKIRERIEHVMSDFCDITGSSNKSLFKT